VAIDLRDVLPAGEPDRKGPLLKKHFEWNVTRSPGGTITDVNGVTTPGSRGHRGYCHPGRTQSPEQTGRHPQADVYSGMVPRPRHTGHALTGRLTAHEAHIVADHLAR